jgi:molecular chaperone GrpE
MRLLPFRRSNTVQLAPDFITRLDGLLAEVGKLGREQFRATTLLEGYGADLDELSDACRDYFSKIDRDSIQPALGELEDQVRIRLAKDLLLVADELHASIAAARELRATIGAEPAARPSLLQRLMPPAAPPPEAAARPAFDAWLAGLVLVERRLLALLEREGVQVIPALGLPFDPHRHLAVAVRAERGVADATVVAEELPGYMLGDRVLRHAEVVIARAEPQLR